MPSKQNVEIEVKQYNALVDAIAALIIKKELPPNVVICAMGCILSAALRDYMTATNKTKEETIKQFTETLSMALSIEPVISAHEIN